MPYLGLAIALFALAVFIFAFRLPKLSEENEQGDGRHYGIFEPLRHRHVLLGVLGLFFYVGAEVSIGSYLVNFLVGLFHSIMFPTIFTLGMAKLGPLTNRASSLLIMAIVGGAVLPLLMGFLADHIGLHHAFVLPLVCYLYIAYYGISGSKVREAVPAAVGQR